MRIVLAGIAGGVAMFMWTFVSHVVTPLGETGIRQIPNEAAVVSAIKPNIGEPGMYFFPGMDMRNATPEQRAEWEAKYKAGPRGMLIYNPAGETPMSPIQLVTELASNILACICAAFVISLLAGSFLNRVLVAGVMGFIGWLSIDASNWIWYGFPASYIVAEGIDQVIGWLVAGAAIAAIVRPRLR